LNLHPVQQRGERRNLVGLRRDLYLGQDHAGAGVVGRGAPGCRRAAVIPAAPCRRWQSPAAICDQRPPAA
jgi:hypothetical protein